MRSALRRSHHRTLLFLTLVSSAALAGPHIGGTVGTRPPGPKVAAGGGGSSSGGGGNYVLFDSLNFPGNSAARIPPCVGDYTCAVLCMVGAVDGSNTWQCVLPDGGAAGTVTDPGGTITDSFIPGVKAREMLTGTDSPSLDYPALNDAGTGANTILVAGYSRGGPSGYDWWFNDTSGTLEFYQSSAQMTWYDSAVLQAIDGYNYITTINHLGWGIYSLRWDGATDGGAHWFANADNGGAKIQEWYSPYGVIGGQWQSPYYFGTRSARDLYLNGPMLFWEVFTREFSDDDVANAMSNFYGVPSDGGTYTQWAYGVSYPTGIDNTDTTGNVDMMNGGGFLVPQDGTGLYSADGEGTNLWAHDALDQGSNVKTGTGIVQTNVSSGPFAVWKNAAECDRLVDEDNSAFFCVWSKDAGITGPPTTSAWWGLSGYLKASDGGSVTSKARLVIRSDGTFPDGGHEVDCDVNGLGYSATRPTCRALLSGSPTYLIGGICVGNAASDKGTVEVCQGQLTNSLSLEPPVADDALRTAGVYGYRRTPPSWPAPNFSAGAFELVTTAPNDPLNDWTTDVDVIYPIDLEQESTYGAGDHTTVISYGYTAPGLLLVTDRDTVGYSDFEIQNIGLIQGHTYATRLEWDTPKAGSKCTARVKHNDCGVLPVGYTATQARAWYDACKATTVIGTLSDPDAGCPAIPDWATFGARNQGSVLSTNQIHALRRYTR